MHVFRPRTRRSAREPESPDTMAGLAAFLEIALLGPLAALLVLWAIPRLFGIESECVLQSGGVEHGVGDSYQAGVAVFGTFGWLLVSIGVVFARIADSRRSAVLLPLAWFLLFVAAALIVAMAIGPQPCPR
jgi:hypothetical protein